MRGVPSAVLATVDDGVGMWGGAWGGAMLEVKGPRDCCWVTITADSKGELEVTGRDGELPGGKKAPRPNIPPNASPSEVMPIAPMSMPLPPEVTPPIQDGNMPPPNASAADRVVVKPGNKGATPTALVSGPSPSWGR